MKNKKYKLLKWFPTLPKDWKVGMELGVGNINHYGNYSPCNAKYSDYYIAPNIVENNPKFFEEIIEKKPLFVTEDGKDVFNDDMVWRVYNDWSFSDFKAQNNPTYPVRKYFSTKEKAEEFIILNKPVLSINDVLNAQDGLMFAEKKLKELVKSRL